MDKKELTKTVLAGLGVFFIVLMVFAFWPVDGNEVAVIPIRGGIFADTVEASPTAVQENIDTARAEGAKAFLFQINSPGGTVVASRQLENVIGNVDEFTVCQLQDQATSGAYWAASACDKIISDPLTITGSIGVGASYLEYSQMMEEEGIEYIRLVEGDLKDMGSPYRDLTDEERELFDNILSKTHGDFTQSVAINRNLTEEEMGEIGRGHIIIGEDALEKGLVDHWGGINEARKLFEEYLEDDINFKEYRKEAGLIELLLGSESSIDLDHATRLTEINIPSLYAIAS